VKRRVSEPRVLRYIDRYVREGAGPIDIDGLGSFELDNGNVVFQASRSTQVFIAYAKEDRAQARRLYRALKNHGLEPWMDEQNLLPGQNWPRAIERAIEVSDYVLVCFSRRSVGKRGFFQSELRYALDVASCVPLDEIFLVPVRLGECEVPLQIARQTQYIDLFPDWHVGIKALLMVMTKRLRDEPTHEPKVLT
jgi:TIR domain